MGPICESADVIGRSRTLSKNLKSGELLIIYDVGAYGAVMSSSYNLRPKAKEIAIDCNIKRCKVLSRRKKII